MCMVGYIRDWGGYIRDWGGYIRDWGGYIRDWGGYIRDWGVLGFAGIRIYVRYAGVQTNRLPTCICEVT
jgi:hypothetical protein